MKTLSGFLFAVAIFLLPSPTQGQSSDTALARIDTKTLEKKAGMPVSDAVKSSEELTSENETIAPQAKFIVPEIRDQKSTDFLDTKAGPNGEDIHADRQGFYYLDEAGEKVRIDTKAMRDKPKHS